MKNFSTKVNLAVLLSIFAFTTEGYSSVIAYTDQDNRKEVAHDGISDAIYVSDHAGSSQPHPCQFSCPSFSLKRQAKNYAATGFIFLYAEKSN